MLHDMHFIPAHSCLTCGPRARLFKVSAVLQVSTVIGAVVKSQREQAAWTEGVAIFVAVMVVSLVGNLLPHVSPSLLPAEIASGVLCSLECVSVTRGQVLHGSHVDHQT